MNKTETKKVFNNPVQPPMRKDIAKRVQAAKRVLHVRGEYKPGELMSKAKSRLYEAGC